MEFLRNNKLLAAAGGLIGIAVVAWLAFGFFGIQAAFIDETVDQADPFAVTAPGAGDTGDGGEADSNPSAEATDDATAAPADDENAADRSGGPASEATTPFVETSGSFIGLDHPAVGEATIISDGEQRFLRFEDFETDNGPDLFVYLVADATAQGERGLFDDDFVNLGRLAGNVGDQNYEVDVDLDLDRYNTVVIWCDRFDAAFGAADLA